MTYIHWLVEIMIHFVVVFFIIASVVTAIVELIDMEVNGTYGNDTRPVALACMSVAAFLITLEIMWWGQWR